MGRVFALCVALCLAFSQQAHACSNLLIPRGSAAINGTFISYAADDAALYGDLSHWPAADHDPSTDLREIYSWDYGNKLGAIPEISHTYNVIGNTNEMGLSIAETTFGGLTKLSVDPVCNETYGCIDYGQLIWVTLARAANAREAIQTMDFLMQTYGYASSGESFSIGDANEIWLMEVIGKGPYGQGTVWVATLIPEGHVCAHANQARTVSLSDPNTEVTYSDDVVSFAQEIGLYDADGSDEDFSFSDVYDPVTFDGARFCESRVWSFFREVAPAPEGTGDDGWDAYVDYVTGYNLTHRMPLYVPVLAPITLNETMWHMRNHFEGSYLDPTLDVGAEDGSSPYRLGEDLTWNYDSNEYVSERFIGTHKTGWTFVAQHRSDLPSILWFGVDDNTHTVHVPFYGIVDKVTPAWSGANCTGRSACRLAAGLKGTITNFTFDEAHWVFNMVSNYAYDHYEFAHPVVQSEIVKVEERFFELAEEADAELARLLGAGLKKEAVAYATKFSNRLGEALVQDWLSFWQRLFMTFMDGCILSLDSTEEVCGCQKNVPGLPNAWRGRIVADTGDQYLVPSTAIRAHHRGTISKHTLI